ncbi:MAG TPA: SDR family oxidoreductase [Polyangia bacterium]|nr:SDR family oxidoreductase [Polyangia bacterium]
MSELSGKVCLVTGFTQGIGKETALGLAKKGATLVLVARDAARAEAAAAEVRAAAASGAAVEVLLADLSSQASVRKLAGEFLARHDRLDVLVNNAGAINTSRKVTVDGLEMTFAVNHLAYFLLTNLLLDAVKKAAPARIINVSSAAHSSGRIDFEDLQGERGYAGFRAYGQSKLANILFTRELARRLDGTRVTANALHPGVVRTGFGRGDGGLLALGVKIAGVFFISPAQGAATTLWLASSPEVANVSGKYFAKCREKAPSRRAQDDDTARKLWDVSAKLTGLTA